ncbi:MAG: NADPH-dependent FMN reductase [Rubrobacteraceae bacterium]
MSIGRLNVVGIGGTLRENSVSRGALIRALQAAEESGAQTELLDLRELDLPLYVPGKKPGEYGEYGGNVESYLEAIREADALIISTAAYHGTLAGVTKNALDFAQFLSRDERPYLDGRVVGLVATAGGDQAATNATGALVNVVHALRGTVAPLMVPIPKAWRLSDAAGNITDENYGGRLDQLGELVVDLASRFQNHEDPGEPALDPVARRG